MQTFPCVHAGSLPGQPGTCGFDWLGIAPLSQHSWGVDQLFFSSLFVSLVLALPTMMPFRHGGVCRESVSPAKRMNFLKKALLSGVRSDKLRAVDGLQGPLVLSGGVSEWLKEHAWKVCIRETVSRVRIPPPPPGQKERKP